MNEVIDKEAAIRAQGGPLVGQPTGHIALTSFLNDALVSYDPYGGRSRAEQIARARREMARSRYDRNHDGRCDAAACRDVRALSLPAFVRMADEIRRNLTAIGITVRVETPTEPARVFALLADPKQHISLALDIGYGKDDLNGAGLFPPSFARSGIGGGNDYSLVGATPAQLRRWGYAVTRVPSVDARIDECQALVGGPQIECWTSLDQYLMEQVVPWVPIAEETHVDVVGRRVARFSFDQLSTLPALERIALRR
jgi:hypothetical protein